MGIVRIMISFEMLLVLFLVYGVAQLQQLL